MASHADRRGERQPARLMNPPVHGRNNGAIRPSYEKCQVSIERRSTTMKKLFSLLTAAALAAVFAGTSVAQEASKKAEVKPAPSASQAVLEQWNDIGRKLIAIAEDLPEDKYDFKPNPDSRTFVAQLLHVSASMYYFTDPAQNKKPRYPDDPKPADLKINSKADLLAYVKQCVKDGADIIK